MTAIRFHLDEHMPHAVAEALRRRGVDVTTTAEAGLEAASDEEHVDYARSFGRVIVTCDQDYLVLDAEYVDHAGIVFWTRKRDGIGYVVGRLIDVWSTRTAEDMTGDVVFV